MTQSFAERLKAARQRQFVGRVSELGVLQAALNAEQWPFILLYVFGPGGVGKTALLSQFQRVCEGAGLTPLMLDARNLEATSEAIFNALRLALNLEPLADVPQALAQCVGRQIIMLDTCENLAPLDAWFRDTFLPGLPENVLVIMAGRQPLEAAWRADPGWQALVRVLPLRNLHPEESRAFLTERGVPADELAPVLNFTHGHPLALALVADVFQQRSGQSFQPESSPDVVKTLLERFVQKVPGPAHRAALEACSMVRVLTESLLATMLGTADAHELFEWLRGLSFIEAGPFGLFPHDLAREALAADVRWRNPDWYAELHKRARVDYVARLQRSSGIVQQLVLYDLIFLHRDNAAVRPVFEWQTGSNLLADAYRESDRTAVLEMVLKHEGADSARWAEFWLARQPSGLIVLRDPTSQPAGFVQLVNLTAAKLFEIDADPATRAAWAYLQAHAPLRPGEISTHFRFWMAREMYQDVSAIQSLVFVLAVRHYLTTPSLAFHFFPCAQAEFWANVFAYADLQRLPEADYAVGGHTFGAYGHDWRVTPPAAWMTLLAERETMAGAPDASPPSKPAASLIVLSETEFADAMREALQDYVQTDLLRANPLLRSRLILERVGHQADEAGRIAMLTALIKDAASTLLASPRDAKLYRALEVTYFKPVGTQEQAAEAIDLPFSTYRRHLKAGLTRLTELLWQKEIGGG
jgi:hypothetical protein